MDSHLDRHLPPRRTVNYRANALIAALPEQDLAVITTHLKPVHLTFDEGLYEYRAPVENVYFPLDCVVSNLILMEDGCAIETGMNLGCSKWVEEAKIRGFVRCFYPLSALTVGIGAETGRNYQNGKKPN